MGDAAKLLLTELKRRFRKFTDPGDDSHEPLFLMATALDPRYRLLLNPTQISSAKSSILNEVCVIVYLSSLLHMHLCNQIT